MSPPSASGNGSARVAVVGAPTAAGSRLREALVEHGVPGAQVDLYGGTRGEVVISEYDGEARMIQEPEPAEVARHEVIFICEESDVTDGIVAAAGPGTFVIDMLGSLAARVGAPRVHMDINPDVVPSSGGRCFAVPHPLTLLLAELLHPLDRELGLAEVIAVVLRPASDFGEQGLEELRDQTVRLLSFAEVPVRTFGRQLAFNVIPQTELAAGEPSLEAQITGEIGELLGWRESHLTVRLLTVPLFHGHGLQLRFRLERDTTPEEVRGVLERAGLSDPEAAGRPATPLEVTGQTRTSLSDPAEDGLGGFWLWVVAGETAARGAAQAVRLAAYLGRL